MGISKLLTIRDDGRHVPEYYRLVDASNMFVSQTSHGFEVLDPIYHNGTTWAKAQANSDLTLADGVVIEKLSDDAFIVAESGYYNITHGLGTTGEYYFLSESTLGGLETSDQPNRSQALLKTLDANWIKVLGYREQVAATGGASGGSGGLIEKGYVVGDGGVELSVSGLSLASDLTYFIEYNISPDSAGATEGNLLFNTDTAPTSDYWFNDATNNKARLYTSVSATTNLRGGFIKLRWLESKTAGFLAYPTAIVQTVTAPDGRDFRISKNLNEGGGETDVTTVKIRSTNTGFSDVSYMRVLALR